MSESTLYRIHEPNREGLEKKLTAVARRAIKLSVTPPIWSFSDVQVENEGNDKGGNPRFSYWYDLTLIAEPVKLAGWTLVGVIDHTTEAGIILRSAPGETIPASYREAANRCDHCQTTRKRNETFVVRHDSGDLKQVGRNCLRDFLGTDATAFAELATLVRDLARAVSDAGARGSNSGHYLSTREYLEWTACAIRLGGWVSRGMAYEDGSISTADETLNLMASKERDKPTPTPADTANAEAALAWAAALSGSLSDYEHNIKVVAQSDALNEKNVGLAASIVAVYLRNRERDMLRKHAAATSAHFGEVKKRAVYTLTLNGVRAFEGNYGPTYLHTFTDAGGNVAKWFGSRELDAEIGTPRTVKATVKAHDEYKGVKQTVLTRVTEFDAAA